MSKYNYSHINNYNKSDGIILKTFTESKTKVYKIERKVRQHFTQ